MEIKYIFNPEIQKALSQLNEYMEFLKSEVDKLIRIPASAFTNDKNTRAIEMQLKEESSRVARHKAALMRFPEKIILEKATDEKE